MKTLFFIVVFFLGYHAFSQTKTVHVYVSLCDNVNQGIVPVPSQLGNGQSPKSNLYWGAAYGLKSYFKYKTKEWTFVKNIETTDSNILERVLFKHTKNDVYMLADAYNGAEIKQCIEDFVSSAHYQRKDSIKMNESWIKFGGQADLVLYIGHNGLMEFDVELDINEDKCESKDAIILACYSKSYFSKILECNQINPLVWTTHLMAPEAYTLKFALDGWMKNESGKKISERAAQAYHKYQKCGINGARRLLVSGY